MGSSNFPGWSLAKFQAAAMQRGFMGLISEQTMYNLLCRWPELEVFPAALDMGIGVIPYMPLAGGILTAKVQSEVGSRTASVENEYGVPVSSDFVCGTLQVASGMNMHVFTTGRGTPYGLSMVPVIKVSSNSKLSKRWFDLIDFDAGLIAFGEKTIEEMGWELFHLILEVASGKKQVACDKLKLHNDLVVFNPGPVT